ncbi:MAG: DUF3071 domain-containing protein [Rhodoluna sp.]|nr:DUF3071 domain-containing protein [Rhodoluna sp.]MBP6186215.1 DUF3071 domain-containing protein [Rhodoluna sp.]
MTELRLNGNDGEYLLLESLTGDQFRVLIDDSLRSAIKSTSSRNTSSVQLSPREIQAEIRSGATVDELVSKSGDPRSYIEKFAAPVQDELSHVIASALSVRISIAGDRYNDISHIEFGEIIASRLEASGVNENYWSAVRDENHQWMISINFERDSASSAATWAFDPKRLLLSPENETAITLSTQNSLGEQTFAKLRTAPSLSTAEATNETETENITESLADTQLVETAIPIGRSSDVAMANRTADSHAENENLATTTDLLDALKKKREERSSKQAEQPEPGTATQTMDVVAEPATPNHQAADEPDLEEYEPRPAPTRRNARPSIPSFDEIVQGTKSEEE